VGALHWEGHPEGGAAEQRVARESPILATWNMQVWRGERPEQGVAEALGSNRWSRQRMVRKRRCQQLGAMEHTRFKERGGIKRGAWVLWSMLTRETGAAL
jgi:hypothetical protein